VFTDMGIIKMEKISKQEYLRALEIANQDDELDQIDKDQADGELSEAERLAAHADAPTLRADGKPVGSDGYARVRALTVSQTLFAEGLIQGKTYKQAYKDAYPKAAGTDASITTSAYKLSRDSRISAMVQDALEQTAEHLAEDRAATQRYVLRQLVAHSKSAKQEGTKLKALELLGKSSGLFTQGDAVDAPVISIDQLKRELGQHLKLVRDKVKAV
jgi:hypothetical protein